MKIKTKALSYDEVMAIAEKPHKKPIKQKPFFRWLLKTLSASELKAVDFTYEEIGMDRLKADEPALFLMNHSSFTDLQIISKLLASRQYHIVCTNDGMIAKEGLMRAIGCIPTKKFISDVNLVRDMKYAIDKLGSSILMYPEASYSFDGTETPLPDSLGKCIKLLGVPVIMIKTEGAFLRDPLYNCLQKRNTKVKATISYLLSPEDIKTLSSDDLTDRLNSVFEYNHFRTQFEQDITVSEKFRADGLHRALYKCPSCKKEGKMLGKGTVIRCGVCSKEYELTVKGDLKATGDAETEFKFVPEWYKWERDCVRKEIEDGTYIMDLDVDIMMLVDSRAIYKVGEGRLIHNADGFILTGCDGKLDFRLSGKSTYSLYADYYWYEIGDMISIGDTKKQFYCFPKNQDEAIVAKARLATEEIYKLERRRA